MCLTADWDCECVIKWHLVDVSPQVELLVMKALSLGLVKGSIDQVDAKVHMTWVQPRVLDRDQVTLHFSVF